MISAIALKDDIKLTADITVSESSKKMTFEEYLLYIPPDDFKYELDQGELIQMTAATGLHTGICEFLFYEIERHLIAKNVPFLVHTSVGVRTKIASSRIPDVIVCTDGLWESLVNKKGAGVLDTGETPELVVEVVSEDRNTDYVKKRQEYEFINIAEYWIIDSKKQLVRLLTLDGDNTDYKEQDFVKGENVVSVRFPGLIIPVDMILSPPVVQNLRREEKIQFLQVSQELESEKQRAESEKQRAESEKQRAESEKQRAESEKQRAESEKQRAESEKQRAEKLAAKLREMGVNIEDI